MPQRTVDTILAEWRGAEARFDGGPSQPKPMTTEEWLDPIMPLPPGVPRPGTEAADRLARQRFVDSGGAAPPR